MNSERTAEVAAVIRNAADRLTASHGTGEAEAVDQIAQVLRGFADSLEEEAANALVDAVGQIAHAKPSTFLAGSVMAGFALEQAGGGDHEAAQDDGAGFVEQALTLFRDSLEGKAHGEIAEAGQHPLPLALAAISIAWLLARQAGEEAGEQPQPSAAGVAPGAERPPQPHREAAVAPGGLGYLMTLSNEEEEQIEWGSKDVT